MTRVTRDGKTVLIMFDTEDQAVKCEEQTKYMFEHPGLVKAATRLIRR